MTEITLVPLAPGNRERFILDNQRSFRYGATEEFGPRDDRFEEPGEIISRRTITGCLDSPDSEAYEIHADGEYVGGAILRIDMKTFRNELEILFINPEFHSRGYGKKAWTEIERIHPETKVWVTITPYFEKRNIHFYVNRCGFRITEFWNEYNKPAEEYRADEDPGDDSEMFVFEKVME